MEHFTMEHAIQLDNQDPLAKYRQEFYINHEKIYLDGNSLGLLSKRAEKTALEMLKSWKNYGIEGWTEGENPWFYVSESVGERMATLVGANGREVIVTGSTTGNLHQLLATFYEPQGNKKKILTDELAFPTDIYAIKSHLKLKGFDPDNELIKVKSRDGHTLSEKDIISEMKDDVRLVILPSILYRSGQILNMSKLTEEAHKRDILIGFDLCHSIGSIPHQLTQWDVDFAFWCNYKHLNGGPGAVGGLYVNQRHFGREPGLAGWFSSKKENQFDMDHQLVSEDHAGAYQMGTPHILSLAPLLGSVDMFQEAGIHKIREKSLKLTEFMMTLLEQELAKEEFIIRNPVPDEQRGGHLFIEHSDAARICKALKENGIVPDFRSPNGIRLAPVALYNTFVEVWKTVQTLKRIMDNGEYRKYTNERGVIA
ncbi:kynureninase [Evansella tamaricis]|uniref:Kynureninase n=1 Tax=Evansella tamaricis TaxID=2069301 RepID=A0ABS6JKB5_9BACI|nr:kynureninase [Evansella tamaricis]MBU9714088.1 kynureninase [Evansella tamaricis]